MYRLYSFGLFLLLSLTVSAQDTTSHSITNYALVEGQTFSWRGTGTFHNMTSWNSTAYTEGYMRYFNQFQMNYRLLFPNRGGSGYDPNYEQGYPMIVMLHGGGERGNCWNNGPNYVGHCPTNGCYENTSGYGYCWDPNTPPVTTDPRLLNNDHNLLHGGQPHLAAVDLAGTKLPDDPTLLPRAFPGFVLFPQNINGWTEGRYIRDAIRLIRLLIKTHNIDPNRIYVHGLSNGGYGVYSALREADWLFAAAAPMSAVNGQTLLGANDGYNRVAKVPMWIFQGALDGNPTPAQTEGLVRNLRNAGAVVRYKKYPNLGHGVWNTAYNEPDFFSWLLAQNKANIHVDFGSPFICGTNGAGASLRLPTGFPAYQWERDGQLIPGATSASYIATIPGTYRARFSRTHSNPTEEQWNRWSDPVLVSERSPEKPELEQIGSVVLQDLNNNQDAVLTAAGQTEEKYYWYQNGNLISISDQTTTLIVNGTNAPRIRSTIELRTSGFDNCQSPPSSAKYLFFGSYPGTGVQAAPTNITRPNNFAARLTSPTSALLTWNDNSGNERGFEIWRRKSTDPFIGNWVMAALTSEDVISFHDTNLEPNTTYLYKIRAVSNNGRSDYWPSNTRDANLNNYLVVNTVSSLAPPAPPQNLTATTTLDQPPISFAGCNQTFRLSSGGSSISAITINTEDPGLFIENYSGTYSIDPDGYIVKYQWRQVSGPIPVKLQNANSPAMIIQGAVEGTYIFSLETTDDNGSTDVDFVTINVVRWTSRVKLTNGSAGYMDIRFTINGTDHDFRADWNTSRTITASQFVSTHQSALSSLGIGVSNNGESIYFTNRQVNAIVDGPGTLNGVISNPQAPITNAGPDQFILDKPGASSSDRRIVLNGYSNLRTTGQDGQAISTRTWTFVSGPNTPSISQSGNHPNARIATITNLIPGTYVFRLTVTDNTIFTSFDDVTVIVSPPQNALSAKLSWDEGPATIKEYYVYYGSDSVSTGVNTNAYVINNLPPNKNYSFTVKAVDQFGNRSSASNQVAVTTYYEGLQYQHTTGVWNNVNDQPDLSLITWNQPEFRGTIDDFNINSPEENPPGVRTQADFFNFRFDGFFYAHVAGTYRFQTVSNEVARVTVNGIQRTLIQTGNDQSQTSTSGNVTLGVGPHRITVEFADFQGDHELQVRYLLPNTGTYVNIPSLRIRSFDANNPPVTPTPPNPPMNLLATSVGMTQNNVSWLAPATGSGYRVVVLGSSTAAGTGASPSSNAWVNRFTTWLQAVAPGSTVTNLAANGYTTRRVVPTGTPSPANPDQARNITAALALNPHLIIVNLPSNDTNDDANNPDIELSETMSNFELIKEAADAEGVKIFFTTTQPRNFTDLNWRDELEEQANLIRSAFGNYVINIYDELTDFTNNKSIKGIYDSGDGIHVNNAGHEYIYTTARDKIIPHLLNYEVYRSTSELTGYELVTRTSSTAVEDIDLLPGTTYYYKVRTVDFNGVSDFTPVANATTFGDAVVPSVPSGVTITAKTFTNVSLAWNASTDNVGVTGYEVFANGNLVGTTDIIGYLVTDLTPNTLYNFTIRAVDASGNYSELSTPVSTTTNNYQVFYSKAAGNLNETNNWGDQSNGSGTAPAGFDFNGQHFVVSNRTTSSLGGIWTVEGGISKVIVPDGVTLTADNAFTARVEVEGTGTVILDNATVPDFISLSSNSTIQYNVASVVQPNTYGHLALGGSGTKTFAGGNTIVNGNLTVANNIGLKGAPGNNTRLLVGGHVTINGTPQFVADDFGIKLELTGTGNKNISSAGDVYLDEINISGTSSVNVVSTSSPFNIRLGGETSGGLTLAANSSLNVGNNTLFLKKQSAINPGNETGRIAINGGNILFASTSASPSNLYFDPLANTINRFEVNAVGGGIITIRESSRVTDGLKIESGNINANGQLMLVSTASKTANLEIIENSGQVSGDLIVQRHMEPEGRIWKYISSPVDGVTVKDWQDSGLPITGNFAGASTGFGTSPSLYYYDESEGGWLPYPPPGGSNSAPILCGVGYSAFIRKTDGPTILEVSGNPYQQNVLFALDGGTGGNTGWNLLGNPYASTIVWNNTDWIKSGINPILSVRDNPSGQFMYWDADAEIGSLPGGKIAPGQAFWVQATNGSPSLTITEQAKRVEQQEFYREGNSKEYAVLKLIKGNQEDQAFILFNSSSDNYEVDADAYKRTNEGMFSFSTITADGIPVAINKLNEVFCSKSIAFNFENTPAGQYTIILENFESMSRIESVTLRDNLLGVDVSTTAPYVFDITTDPLTYNRDRFTLTINRSEIDLPTITSTTDVCTEEYAVLILGNTGNDLAYQVINQNQQVVAGPINGNSGSTSIQIDASTLSTGSNPLKIQVIDNFCSGEITTLPNSIQIIKESQPVVTANQLFSICADKSATLTANTTAGTLQWFNEKNELVGTGETFITPTLTENTIYTVKSTLTSGCLSAPVAVTVNTEELMTPLIRAQQDTLFATGNGNYQWFKDGLPIFNATAYFYITQEPGTYMVSSKRGDCIVFSQEFQHLVTSTESPIGGILNIMLYPNPASQEQVTVVIETSEQAPIELTLLDMFGRTVYAKQITDTEAKQGIIVNAEQSLSAGLYLVIGKQGNTSLTRKLIVK